MLKEIDKQAKLLGVYIIAEPTDDNKGYVAVTAIDTPDGTQRVVCGVSKVKATKEIAIIEAWENGLQFYEKIKNGDKEILDSITD